MPTRTEIARDVKEVINCAVAAKKNLDDARSGLTALIRTTADELIAERRPGTIIDGITARKETTGLTIEDTLNVRLELQVFPLPKFDGQYAITRGLPGIIELHKLSDGTTEPAIIATAIYTRDIPLVGVHGPDYDLTIENVVVALAELREGLIGTGIEG